MWCGYSKNQNKRRSHYAEMLVGDEFTHSELADTAVLLSVVTVNSKVFMLNVVPDTGKITASPPACGVYACSTSSALSEDDQASRMQRALAVFVDSGLFGDPPALLTSSLSARRKLGCGNLIVLSEGSSAATPPAGGHRASQRNASAAAAAAAAAAQQEEEAKRTAAATAVAATAAAAIAAAKTAQQEEEQEEEAAAAAAASNGRGRGRGRGGKRPVLGEKKEKPRKAAAKALPVGSFVRKGDGTATQTTGEAGRYGAAPTYSGMKVERSEITVLELEEGKRLFERRVSELEAAAADAPLEDDPDVLAARARIAAAKNRRRL